MGKGNHLRKVMKSEKLSLSRLQDKGGKQDIDGQRGPVLSSSNQGT